MASTSKFELPGDFLDGPAPNLKKTKVNWNEGGLPEYDGMYAVILDGVLSEQECDQFIAGAEATTDGVWERAMVNIGMGKQALYEETRKCGRIIWDSSELVGKLWARVSPALPEIQRLENMANITGNGPVKRNEVWKASRLNDRMRFLKYTGGEYFKAHCDGTYETPDRSERSYYTLHLYLNDAMGKDGERQLEGGATTFHSYFNLTNGIDVIPRVGRVLVFQHRGLLHSGEDLVKGIKYTMRTDIMYSKEDA